MDKIYIIKFDNGESYEDNDVMIWGFVDTENDANELVIKLNEQLNIDRNRVKYLENICDDNNINTDEYKELRDIYNKYPNCWCDNIAKFANFYYEEVRKLVN